MIKVGLIVNPIAGVGGPKALRGSDGSLPAAALARGARMQSVERTEAAVRSLISACAEELTEIPSILTCAGAMGEEALISASYENFEVVYHPESPTTADDTVKAAKIMKQRGVELLLFTGGDGTARDIVSAVGSEFPVLGIPSGVKMFTGIFLYRPDYLGRAIVQIAANGMRTSQEYLLDFEERGKGEPIGVARFGKATVPVLESVQSAKSESTSDEEELEGIGAYLSESLRVDSYYVVGTGRTVKALMSQLGYNTPVLGVDLLKGNKLEGQDLTDSELNSLLSGVGKGRIFVIVTPLGGNGFIFGRGNQQISPELLKDIPRKNVVVVSTTAKVNRLERLRVDTGSGAVDSRLKGLTEVIIGYGRRRVCEIV